MITQLRVWELMSVPCKYLRNDHCLYYGSVVFGRRCECETCPILGSVGVEVLKTGELKYLQWLPVVGIFFIMYYAYSRSRSESIIYTHFWLSMLWQAAWTGIGIPLMVARLL